MRHAHGDAIVDGDGVEFLGTPGRLISGDELAEVFRCTCPARTG